MAKSASHHYGRETSSSAAWRVCVVLLASTCALFTVYQYNSLLRSRLAPAQLANGVQHHQQQQQHAKAVLQKGSKPATFAAQQLQLSNATLKYFPQARRCNLGAWAQQYAALHQHILSGAAAPRYLVSLTAGTGLADKLVGTVTSLWHAVLTQRALSVVSYPGDPSLSDVCEAPLFDWSEVPGAVSQDALDALRPADLKNDVLPLFVELPASYDPGSFAAMYLHNKRTGSQQVYNNSLSLVQLDPTYLLLTSNRGRTYQLAAQNPHHRQQFKRMGVAPTDAFMCGFFAFCSPVPTIQQYYQRFWDALQQPGLLRIGIQVRAGDRAMAAGSRGGDPSAQKQRAPPREVLRPVSHFFKCAERLEAAYSSQGQKVVWFLNSDSQEVRQAAKEVYGSKLLTDDSLQMVHPECSRHGASESGGGKQACEEGTLQWALLHSLGSVLTFSMTDLQVISQSSGFGRAGAWLADRRDGIYELKGGASWARACVPKQPTAPAESSQHWSGI